MSAQGQTGWSRELASWREPFLEALAHSARRHWVPCYLRGLLLSGERKSIQPMAARLGRLLAKAEQISLRLSWAWLVDLSCKVR